MQAGAGTGGQASAQSILSMRGRGGCMMRAMASPHREFDAVDVQVLVDSIPALIHTARPDGHLDYFNKRWLEYLGASLDEVAGWNWTAFVHPEDVEGILARWRACLVTGEIFEYETRVLQANGDYRWMYHRKVPVRDADGNIVKWYGSSLDIDERKTSEEKIRRLVDANILGIFIGHVEGAIIEANDAFLRMVQYGREDVVSGRLHWTDLTPPEWRERDQRAESEVKATRTIQPYEKEYFRKDGSRVPVMIGSALFE